MFNLGGGEILVILFIALIVLGPDKLPEAARKAGRAMAELRRLSGGFQQELQSALQEPPPTARRANGTEPVTGDAAVVESAESAGDAPPRPPDGSDQPDHPDHPDHRQAS